MPPSRRVDKTDVRSRNVPTEPLQSDAAASERHQVRGDVRTPRASLRPEAPALGTIRSTGYANVGEHYEHTNPRSSVTRLESGTGANLPVRVRPITDDRRETPALSRLRLTPLLEKFASFGEDAYASLASFCTNNPEIWDEDPNSIQPLVLEYLRRGEDEMAHRRVQRMLMLSMEWRRASNAEDQQEWLDSLARSASSREGLNKAVERVYDQLRTVAAQSSQPRPTRGEVDTSSDRHSTTTTRGSVRPQELLPRGSSTQVPGSAVPDQTYSEVARDLKPTNKKTVTASQEHQSKLVRRQSNATLPSDLDSLSHGPRLLGNFFVGPSTFVEGDWPQEARTSLRKEFKVYYGDAEIMKVFRKGSLIAVFWHENHGRSPQNKALNEDKGKLKAKGFVTKADNGEVIYSHIRRFIVVTERKGFCVALPITSYSNKGLSAKSISSREHNAHCIVYDQHSQPRATDGEAPFTKDPVCVHLIPGHSLSRSSRLYYAKPYPIEHNTKVRYLGFVIPEHVPQVLQSYRNEAFSH